MLYQKKDYFSPIPSATQKKNFFGPPVVQKKYMISPSLIATQKKVWQSQVPNVPLVFFKQTSLSNISLFFSRIGMLLLLGVPTFGKKTTKNPQSQTWSAFFWSLLLWPLPLYSLLYFLMALHFWCFSRNPSLERFCLTGK